MMKTTLRFVLPLILVLCSSTLDAQRPVRKSDRGRPGSTPASVTGVVSAVSGTSISILDGLVVLDASEARFFGHGRGLTIADVKAGDLIQASIDVENSTSTVLKALTVSIQEQHFGSIAGPVSAIDIPSQTFQVLGQTIAVTAETRFVGTRGGPTPRFDSLEEGDPVLVQLAHGSEELVARTVHILSPAPTGRLLGVVRSIGESIWLVQPSEEPTVTVVLTSNTRVTGNPRVGDTVMVLGDYNDSGELVAQIIEKARPSHQPAPVRFEGTVDSISDRDWVVSGRSVKVSPATRIVGNPIVGDRVRVTGKADMTGRVHAEAIEKL